MKRLATAIAGLVCALSVLQGQDPTALRGRDPAPAAGFHHVHLNSADPSKAIAFYTKTFDVTKRASLAGWDGIQSEHMYLLLTEVASPAPAELNTAVWHFGWCSPNMKVEYPTNVANGLPIETPMTMLGSSMPFA